jgi:predicted N-acetyltransferase YhbS
MNITYKYNDTVTVEELFGLLDQMIAFDGDRFPARNVFHTALRNDESEAISLKNSISMTARNADGLLVGYLRLLTDHVYIYYILDVMVAPSWRKRGIGEKLVGIAVEKSKSSGFMKIFLTAIPGSENFYQKFGFKASMSPVLTIRGEDYQQPTTP